MSLQSSLLHIDTALAITPQLIQSISTSLSGVRTTVSSGVPNIIKHGGNPFDVTYQLSNPRSSFSEVILRSAEIPVGFFNIRSPFNVFSVYTDGIHTFTVSPAYYPDIASLISTLNASTDQNGDSMLTNGIVLFVSGTQIGFVMTGAGSGYIITNIDNGQPNIASMIGFYNHQTFDDAVPIYGPSPFRISFDDYINIYIPLFRGSSSEPNPITFKVQVDNSVVVFYTSLKSYVQRIVNTDTTLRLQTIDIQIRDRFGSQLDNNGLDWSLTLEIMSNP